MSIRHEQPLFSEEEQRQRIDMARRLAEEAHRNALDPEISVEFIRTGALGDEHAVRWLAQATGELDISAHSGVDRQ